MSGIQYIHDSNKNNMLRTGTYIQNISAMYVWDDVLVLGSGATNELYPNLQFADWDRKTEMGKWSSVAGDWATKAITSQRISKNWDLDLPDIKKQISKVVLFYRGNTDWSASGSIKLYYRLDGGDWTEAADITIATTDGLKVGKYRLLTTPPAYNIQLKLETDDDFEVLKVMFYYT
ncbi:unnamed protein product, partial [marine sediment metagenome]